MKCPQCDRQMHNCGNVSGAIFMTFPPSWLETHACHACRVKLTVRGIQEAPADLSFLEGYADITERKENQS